MYILRLYLHHHRALETMPGTVVFYAPVESKAGTALANFPDEWIDLTPQNSARFETRTFKRGGVGQDAIRYVEGPFPDFLDRQQLLEHRRTRLQSEYSRSVTCRVSSSPEDLLGIEFICTFAHPQVTLPWFEFVPSHLGASAATDAAARAALEACHFHHDTDSSQIARCTTQYLKAIKLLRASMDTSDSALLAVGLLLLYEQLMRSAPVAFFSHAKGISSILLASRAQSMPLTPLGRAMLYSNTHGTFQEPCVHGVASPFEDPYWLDAEPASFTSTLTAEVAALRKLSNQLIIRLPRLIAMVRWLRDFAGRQRSERSHTSLWTSREKRSKAMKLADELVALNNTAAENSLLHQVAVVTTRDPHDRVIIPYSFNFKSQASDNRDTLLLYWASRLMVYKLYDVLYCLNSLDHSEGATHPSDIASEQERMVMNIFMCWEGGYGQANPLTIVWSTLMNKRELRGRPVEDVRTWMLHAYEELLDGWPVTITKAEVDDLSDVFAGGPIKGFVSQAIPGMKSKGQQ